MFSYSLRKLYGIKNLRGTLTMLLGLLMNIINEKRGCVRWSIIMAISV